MMKPRDKFEGEACISAALLVVWGLSRNPCEQRSSLDLKNRQSCQKSTSANQKLTCPTGLFEFGIICSGRLSCDPEGHVWILRSSGQGVINFHDTAPVVDGGYRIVSVFFASVCGLSKYKTKIYFPVARNRNPQVPN